MADMTKHVGVYGEKSHVVVFRTLPDDEQNGLVIPSDST